MPANAFNFCDARGKIISSCFISRWILLGSFCETYRSYMCGEYEATIKWERNSFAPERGGGKSEKKESGKAFFLAKIMYTCANISA